ncbi:MAG: glycerate kinase [Candidatus Nanopelagicales bacterium]
MRIVIAPDEFKESLTAASAARSMVLGWRAHAPHDEFDLCPLSDGGSGFVETLHAALGGELLACVVTGPTGNQVPATILRVGTTAYVESAQACGLHLVARSDRDPTMTTTFGVGELIEAAIAAGAQRIVIGLGGSGTHDGGAGMLGALGAVADVDLTRGGGSLAAITSIDIAAARQRCAGIEVLAATDVDSPLLGVTGAARTFAAQKGADEFDIMRLEGAMQSLRAALGRRSSDGKDPAVALGAGAAGGLAFGLLHLGAERVAGIDTVMAAVDFRERVAQADVVVTGEGLFDWQSLRGKVVTGVANAALEQARPCVVIAGDVIVGRREYSAMGVNSAYSVAQIVGSVQASLADPADSLAFAARRVAQTWSN